MPFLFSGRESTRQVGVPPLPPVPAFPAGPLFLALVALTAAAPAASTSGPIFRDVAAESGLVFRHFNGMTGDYYFPEMTGQGGALLDYDNDGDLDVYLVQGGMLAPGKTLADALERPPQGVPLSDRLFRNDGLLAAGGPPRLRFLDVTEASGLRATGYGMGVAAGDIDNDGWVDLYVTNYGANQLWRNRGDGTFVEETASRGAGDDRWSTSAAFADLDADGWLDLYVVNYVEFDVVRNPACFATSTRRDYCGPDAFPPLPDRLLRNTGGGRFEDATSRLLADYRPGPGLGVAVADFDGDRRLDLFVANDGRENQLWLARPDGTFVDESLFAGVAVNREGRAEASMGVVVADFDRDGHFDLFLTHLMGETNTLYRNEGGGLFEDRTLEAGLGAPSTPFTAFGTVPLDYDNDGWEDLVALNGAVRILEDQAAAGDPYPLRQPNQLFRNREGRFQEVTAVAGGEMAVAEVSRGAAAGDVDNDGDTDLVVFNNNGPARLLLNEPGSAADWIGWRAVRSLAQQSRDDLGAVVSVAPAGGAPLRRRVATDGSYCSASDPRGVAGLGSSGAPRGLRVDWAVGGASRWIAPPVERYLVLSPVDRRER